MQDPLIGLVGLVLVFVAVKYIAEETKNHKIFQDYLMNFILNIIAIGAVTLSIVVGVFILLVAKILEIVSFFSLPENLPTAPEFPKTETTSS